ncbi:MAG: carbon storage regulator [Gammaproteobacteria bacterium]|nr:carbon storage regulator [Gammaproteobacteria bacterium]
MADRAVAGYGLLDGALDLERHPSANEVRIGIDAPKDVTVHREEIYEKVRQEKSNTSNWAGRVSVCAARARARRPRPRRVWGDAGRSPGFRR